jgi:tetratricopeptide (TPR) repeat protein
VSGAAAKEAYSRDQARRLADITERQLRSWERQKLVSPSDSYAFPQLVALRTLAKLKKSRLPAAQIRRTLAALTRQIRGIQDPLTQLKIYADGRKIRVELEGRAMEAESGQLLLDFDPADLKRLVEFHAKKSPDAERDRRAAAERWFQRGLELEQTGSPIEEIVDAYRKALELDPRSTGALVNLGTIYFNARNWKEAERYYTTALDVDPQYALAHFDLANLYDERGERAKALEHYLAALRVSPNYADAHYNIALVYQGSNQPMKAARHWAAYLKLDPSSQWATLARRELAKLREATVVGGRSRITPN